MTKGLTFPSRPSYLPLNYKDGYELSRHFDRAPSVVVLDGGHSGAFFRPLMVGDGREAVGFSEGELGLPGMVRYCPLTKRAAFLPAAVGVGTWEEANPEGNSVA
jgi:hypothetical protein